MAYSKEVHDFIESGDLDRMATRIANSRCFIFPRGDDTSDDQEWIAEHNRYKEAILSAVMGPMPEK